MPQHRFQIQAPFDISLKLTVESHGWVGLAPWHWDAEAEVLSRPDRLPTGHVVRLSVAQDSSSSISVTAESDVEVEDLSDARLSVKRWLSLDWYPDEAIEAAVKVDTSIADVLRTGGGRMLRCSTFYEDFVKTVCTIQISWAGTRRMVDGLVALSGQGLFPTPVELQEMGETRLRNEVKLGFRARTVADSTRALLELGLIDEEGRADEDRISREVLIGLRGIGPYAANHMAVLLHDFSGIPVDSAVTSYCRESLGVEPGDIEDHFAAWGNYRFLGYRMDRIARRTQAAT
jgi:3-methyladenine DNA glycosylase/8-oxoguanine DNA glycosylase